MKNQRNKCIAENLFKHNTVKSFCVIVYFTLLIFFYVCMVLLLIDIFKDNVISALNVFLIISSMVIAPIVLMVFMYPIYALAHLCQKVEVIDDRQKEIELLIAKIVVEERENNNKNN